MGGLICGGAAKSHFRKGVTAHANDGGDRQGKHLNKLITGPVGLAEELQLRFDEEKGALVTDIGEEE